uniref:Uncharacterized protein n=1 Tax=Setaria viridis TaxID=4556 RepID=A0A4V6D1D6_SETVI|nr:hypothetical protein SEVIR_9G281800v2 [Setaria viridis]
MRPYLMPSDESLGGFLACLLYILNNGLRSSLSNLLPQQEGFPVGHLPKEARHRININNINEHPTLMTGALLDQSLNTSTSNTATPTVVTNQQATTSRNHAVTIRNININTNTSSTIGCPRRRPRSSRRLQHQRNEPQHRRHLRHPARLTFNTSAITNVAPAPSARGHQHLPRHQQCPRNVLQRQQPGHLHAATHM